LPPPIFAGSEHIAMTDRDTEPGRAVPAKTLSEWRIEQLETRLEKELNSLRSHIDKCVSEMKNAVESELKDLKEHNDKRFGKIENFIIMALVFIATPVVGGMVALVLKNPPAL
jgi:hypothetical protein